MGNKRRARTEDAAPWDDDDNTSLTVYSHDVSADTKPRKNVVPGKGSFRGALPVAAPTADLDGIQEGHEAYGKAMRRLAKRVRDLDRPYNSVAIKEEATRQALGSIMRLVQLSEQQYIETRSDKSSYAHSNLLSQQQSLLAEMATMVTTDAQAERVIAEVMRPAFADVLQFVVAEIGAIRQALTNAKDMATLQRNTNQSLGNLLRSLGTYMQEASDKAESETARALK